MDSSNNLGSIYLVLRVSDPSFRRGSAPSKVCMDSLRHSILPWSTVNVSAPCGITLLPWPWDPVLGTFVSTTVCQSSEYRLSSWCMARSKKCTTRWPYASLCISLASLWTLSRYSRTSYVEAYENLSGCILCDCPRAHRLAEPVASTKWMCSRISGNSRWRHFSSGWCCH